MNQKVMIAAANHPNITVITQTNLAIVMSAALSTEPLTEDSLSKMIKDCQVKISKIRNAEDSETDDDDF